VQPVYRNFVYSRYLEYDAKKTKSPPPKSDVPETVETAGQWFPNAKRVTVRYGPYRLPGIHEKNFESIFLKVSGMTNTFQMGVKKPCDSCVLLALDAGLQNADGSPANTTTGAYLHHMGLVSK
jgi:hypothetical protein